MKFLTLLLSFSLSFSVFATTTIFDTEEGRHFIELYEQEGMWVVENYLVRPGRLQEKVLRRSFPLKTQARQLIDGLQQGRTELDKSFRITTREASAVALWNVTQAWDLQWEEKYSQWVEQNFDKDFFNRNQLATDCADVAYSLRWIFARSNGLPMGATLAGTQVVFTQDSGKAEWAQLPTHADWRKDQRFLKALDWLLNNVYTRTLWIDAYPLEISARSIRPGVINLLGGHTELVARLINDGKTIPIQLLSSTVPRQVRELYGRAMTDAGPVAEDQGGLLQFRWLEKIQGSWVLRAKTEMPLYSREQYQAKLCEGTENFSMCIYQRLGLTFNPRTAVISMADSLTELSRARVAVVREGLNFCTQNNCAPGTQGWEDHSTPTRDRRLLSAYNSGLQVVGELSVIDSTLYDLWNKTLAERLLSDVRADLSLGTFLERLNLRLVSNDPRDPWESRWASTLVGVGTTVKNVFDRQAPLREQLLTQAAACRQDRTRCTLDSPLFASTNTLELDYHARTWLARYAHFCLTQACPTELLPTRWESTWFQSSLPWDGLDLRRGTTRTQLRSQVFFGIKYIDELGDAVLFDQQKLVHRVTGAVISTPASARLVFHAKQKHLLALGDRALHIWNGSRFVRLPTPELAELPSEYYDTYPLGQHHLILIPRSETPQAWVVDLRTGAVRLRTPYTNFTSTVAGPQASVLTIADDVGGKLLFEEQGKLRIIAVGPTELPHSLWGLDDGRWIGARTFYETSKTMVYAYTASRVEKLVELPLIYSNHQLSDSWLVQVENAVWVLNKTTWQIERRYPGVWINNTTLYGDLEIFRLSYLVTAPDTELLLHQNDRVTEFRIPRGHKLLAVHPDWLSFQHDQKKFSIVDHQGRDLLATLEQQSPKNCAPQVYDQLECASLNPLHAGWGMQFADGTATWAIMNMGNYGKLNSTQVPWAQGLSLTKEGTERPMLSTGGYTNLEGGAVFSPFTGVLIYFPK